MKIHAHIRQMNQVTSLLSLLAVVGIGLLIQDASAAGRKTLVAPQGAEVTAAQATCRLHEACRSGDARLVGLLIEQGADVNAETGEGGMTARDYAIERLMEEEEGDADGDECIQLLDAAGARR